MFGSIPAQPATASALPRTLVLTMRCGFSAAPVAALLGPDSPVDPVAIVLAADAGGPPLVRLEPPPRRVFLPIAGQEQRPAGPSLDDLAVRRGIPRLVVGDMRSEAVQAALSDLRPDLVLVACFTRRLPPWLLKLPRHGAWNLHPSLLPRWRGPEPLFWTWWAGDPRTGVSLHRMDASFDTGPVLAQRAVPVEMGQSVDEVEATLSALGTDLLRENLAGIVAGSASSLAQAAERSTPAPYPTPEDRIIPLDWPVERAVHFLAGAGHRYGPFAVRTGQGTLLPVTEMVDWWPDGWGDVPSVKVGKYGLIEIQFSSGTLHALSPFQEMSVADFHNMF